MEKIYEAVKFDLGLKPQTINNSNVSGDYFELKDYRTACAVLTCGAMAATNTTKIEILEATDAAGTSAAAISSATGTVTANALVNEATVTLATVLATEAIVINGLTFTAHATVTTAADREFSISGSDTADAAELVTLINDATYGCSGVTASSSAGVVTLKSTDRGATTITASSSDATFTIATTQAQAYVDLCHFDLSSGFSHIAAKVTTTGNTPVSVALLRGQARETITQAAGASAAL